MGAPLGHLLIWGKRPKPMLHLREWLLLKNITPHQGANWSQAPSLFKTAYASSMHSVCVKWMEDGEKSFHMLPQIRSHLHFRWGRCAWCSLFTQPCLSHLQRKCCYCCKSELAHQQPTLTSPDLVITYAQAYFCPLYSYSWVFSFLGNRLLTSRAFLGLVLPNPGKGHSPRSSQTAAQAILRCPV